MKSGKKIDVSDWIFRPARLAWLALSGVAVIAFALAVGVWVALRAGNWGTGSRGLLEACLLIPYSLGQAFWSWMAAHPLAALALAFIAASMVWAVGRLVLSLVAGWRLRKRLLLYKAGQFPLLDRALRLTPEVEPARIRVFGSMIPEAFTVGPVRPKICLSVGLLQGMTELEVQAVLRHEDAHARARDPMRLTVIRLLSDFLWFLPVTRTLAQAFSTLAELRADEQAVSAGSDSVELASAIVKTARRASSRLRLAPALGGLALVEQRVTRLLGREQTFRLRIPWRVGLPSGVVLVTLLALLMGPVVGMAGARSLDPMSAMQSMMMDCASEHAARAGQPMKLCGEFDSVRTELREGVGI